MPPDATHTTSLRCPDDDLLSRFAEGTLPPPRRADVEAHVAACDECRRLVAGLARAGVLPVSSGRRRGRLLGFPLSAIAAAAVVLVAVGAYLWTRPTSTGSDMDARLVAAAKDLSARRPDLAFTPLGAAERRAGATDVRRGGLSPLVPAGTTLAARPDFRWSPVAGAKSYELTVIDAEGSTVLRATTTEPVVPGTRLQKDLARGSEFVWKVKAVGAQPPAEGTKAFSIAGDEIAAAFAAGRAAIQALSGDAPRDLLLAHFAFRRGLLAEALDAARRHVAASPEDATGKEMLDRIVKDLGPGATDLR